MTATAPCLPRQRAVVSRRAQRQRLPSCRRFCTLATKSVRGFRDTLHMIADGKVDVTPLVTGTVGLPGVAAAFDALADPKAHAKILIDPKSDATSPTPQTDNNFTRSPP